MINLIFFKSYNIIFEEVIYKYKCIIIIYFLSMDILIAIKQ